MVLLAGCRASEPTVTPTVPPVPTPSAELAGTDVMPAFPPPSTAPEIYWPTTTWRASLPEAQGVDTEKLADLFDLIAERDAPIDGLLIVRHGYVISEAYFYPYAANIPHALASITKSVVSTLAGIALAQGQIPDWDAPVLSYFPDYAIQNRDARKENLQITHLLMMTTGLDWPESSKPYGSIGNPVNQMMASDDWVRFVLDRPLFTDPGARFNYNSGASHLLGILVGRAVDMPLPAFAADNLFHKLGIRDVSWATDNQGRAFGGGGLYLTPRDLAKLGYLYLHQGVWEEETIVPASWITRATTGHIETPGEDTYGYQWWISPQGYYKAVGHGGQYLFVVPEADLLLVVVSGLPARDEGLPESLLRFYVMPAILSDDPLPPNPTANARLAQTITAVAAPNPKPVPPLPPLAAQISGQVYELNPNALDWQRFSLTFDEDGTEAELVQTFATDTFTTTIGLDNVFRLNEADGIRSGVRGYWLDANQFVVEQRVPGEIDRLQVTMQFAGNEAIITLRWVVASYTRRVTGQRVEE